MAALVDKATFKEFCDFCTLTAPWPTDLSSS